VSADLIVFGEDWGVYPSSTQHLIAHLPGERRVVWVNSIGLRRPRLTAGDLGRAVRKARAAFHRPAPAPSAPGPPAPGPPAPGPIVQPLILPMARSAPGRALNRLLLARSVGGAARAAGLRRPVLWISLPSAVDAVGALGEAGVVYYCCDDFGALAGVDHARCRAMEAELAERADLVLAASPALAARFPAGKTHLLPHGVDTESFTAAAPRAPDLPAGRVAGFYGTLAPWLDYRLIAAVAGRLPDWRFVFIGPVAADISAIAGLPNVVLLGPRPHASLPGYAQHWTAGLIPFLDNEQIRACNPLKLREYLAAGRPIVATPFPALLPYAAHVATAATAADFAAALEAAAVASPAAVAGRQAAVATESWSARAARAASLIDALAR
jgi:glycosyltransferase involved in cell wall biosynthesis